MIKILYFLVLHRLFSHLHWHSTANSAECCYISARFKWVIFNSTPHEPKWWEWIGTHRWGGLADHYIPTSVTAASWGKKKKRLAIRVGQIYIKSEEDRNKTNVCVLGEGCVWRRFTPHSLLYCHVLFSEFRFTFPDLSRELPWSIFPWNDIFHVGLESAWELFRFA